MSTSTQDIARAEAEKHYCHAAFEADPSIEQTYGWEQLLIGQEQDRISGFVDGWIAREQSAQPQQQPVAMIHNDYDASVACSNCGTDGGFSTYDDLDWARCCPGCGRPISEQVDAKGSRTPHPLYAAPVPSQQPSVSVEKIMEVVGEWHDWYADQPIQDGPLADYEEAGYVISKPALWRACDKL